MEPSAALEEKLQDWYDTEHFPKRRNCDGLPTAGRYIYPRRAAPGKRIRSVYDTNGRIIPAEKMTYSIRLQRSQMHHCKKYFLPTAPLFPWISPSYSFIIRNAAWPRMP